MESSKDDPIPLVYIGVLMLDSRFIDKHVRVIFPLPAVLFVSSLMIFPVLYTLSISFTNWNLTSGLPGRFVGIKTYLAILQEPRFWAALWRTLYFTVLAVFIETILGMIWALILNKEFKGKGITKLFLLMPMVSTPVAIGISWTLFYEPTIGLANWALKLVGLPSLKWIADPNLVIPSIILVDVWQWTPMMALIILAGLAGLSIEPVESARVDGAGPFQIFRHITLPMVAPVILTAVVLRSIDALKTYDIIYAMTNGGPGFASETLNIYAYNLSFSYFRLGNAAVVLFFLFTMVMILSYIVARMRTALEN
jgi:multiple sugar transport system permease protein